MDKIFRHFIGSILRAAAPLLVTVSLLVTAPLPASAVPFLSVERQPFPTAQQIVWQQMEMYAFLHFSINTYTDQEWGYCNEPAALFNPTRLDARQWVRTCKAAGMKGIILTAKHHCGFCLWPTSTTDYSVRNSPWKGGKGDVVRELAEACREEGLKLGIYVSPWDRHAASYGTPAYIEMQRQQLRELLTGYGDIFEVWFDGANGGTGWYGGANENRQIDHRTYYDWPETYRLVRQWQPDAVIWGDNAAIADLRWVGTEAGYVGQPNWSLLPTDRPLDNVLRQHGDEHGTAWVPGEVDTSIRPGWFWHESENAKVKTLAQLMDIYYKSVGRGSTLLLNFPITPDGLIDTPDSITAVAFGRYLSTLFAHDLAAPATKQSSVPSVTTLTLPCPTEVNRILLGEDTSQGQRVSCFRLEAEVDGRWVELRDELLPAIDSLTTIGYKRIVCFPTVSARRFRLTILATRHAAPALITRFSLYLAPPIVEPE
ncbi:MAG: alpha-L-fucosidase [Bacteroidaceae bacterium]|nr:alpha-L-fucosidase [Bacteroidaceae bacterium]